MKSQLAANALNSLQRNKATHSSSSNRAAPRKFDAKAVCLDLLAAESEETVESIMESVPEMRDARNWRPLDRRETNFNITSNQASDGGKALTELMTNMVDAVLMKHAYQKSIDPRGKAAPKTMYQAVAKLIKQVRAG